MPRAPPAEASTTPPSPVVMDVAARPELVARPAPVPEELVMMPLPLYVTVAAGLASELVRLMAAVPPAVAPVLLVTPALLMSTTGWVLLVLCSAMPAPVMA